MLHTMARRMLHITGLAALVLAFAPAAWAADQLGPTAIAENSQGVTYIGFPGGGKIHRLDSAGAAQTSWGTPGSAAGQIGAVMALAVAPGGDVWVLDDNRRLQEFT